MTIYSFLKRFYKLNFGIGGTQYQNFNKIILIKKLQINCSQSFIKFGKEMNYSLKFQHEQKKKLDWCLKIKHPFLNLKSRPHLIP